jgi:hypothetical protein
MGLRSGLCLVLIGALSAAHARAQPASAPSVRLIYVAPEGCASPSVFEKAACVDGAYCAGDVCRPVVPKGGACSTNDECGGEHTCDNGVCGTKFGQPCGDDLRCDYGVCAAEPDAAPNAPLICMPLNYVGGTGNNTCTLP